MEQKNKQQIGTPQGRSCAFNPDASKTGLASGYESSKASGGEAGDSSASSRWERATEQASRAIDKSKERVRGAGSSIAHRAGSVTSGAVTYTKGACSATKNMARRMSTNTGEAVERHPVALACGILACGLLAGLLLPRTSREDELLGEQSEAVSKYAKRRGQELAERGKAAGIAGVQSVVSEVTRRGFSAEGIVEKARTVGRRATDAAREALQEEGLTPTQMEAQAREIAEEAAHTAKEKLQKGEREV